MRCVRFAKRRMHAMEMERLRNTVGVTQMARVRNEAVRRRAGRELVSRVDQKVFRWFSSSSSSFPVRPIGPLPAKCWPEALNAEAFNVDRIDEQCIVTLL